MQLTGSQVIIECLKEQGVDTVFGYPGGAILNVYDELYKHPEIRHVLTSHEQGASHAADGYARSTGKVGVCFATSGPGATNLVTGISTAYMDSIPMVAITCNVGVSLLGKDSFQEVDIAGITTPVTKYSFIVKDVEKLADTIRRAFDIARKGRPGPVLVDIPKDVTANMVEFESKKIEKPKRLTEMITDEDIDKAVKDAEAHAEEDKKKKEEIEVKNNAESLIYNSEKTLTDLGDKVSGEEKAKIETEIENTKKALETNNTETIKEATEKLTKVFYEMSEQLYKNGNPNAGADANATTGASEANTNNAGNDGNVYDADYKVEDDNK